MAGQKTIWIGLAVLALVVFAAGIAFTDSGKRFLFGPPPANYSSMEYGIAFSYPSTFSYTERDILVQGIPLHVIAFLHEDAEVSKDGKGPLNVSIIIGNIDATTTTAEWLNRFQSAIGGPSLDFKEAMLAGGPALRYTSNGLYEAENIASSNAGKIYIVSLSHQTRRDKTLGAFKLITKTFRFTAGKAL